ncbi:putative uncharacterized protein DDB_G0290521 [Drosophila simulans]|uniref:putative uncharacterized protein DDB_G0290521 n=1 Tax=Drosophila simulans TaxID=7240 RepID=UPI001D1177A9|nr:putative uncharacterized protein DDB_G0290521 [Drosophila simulans]
MAAHVFHAQGVRETGAGEQPGAIWSRDSDSYLQLLASPLVSRSPSPGSVEDPEEIPDVELEDDQPSKEDDDGGETVTPEVSSDEDETARMAYRSVRRATQGQGRISLGVAPPTEDPVDMLTPPRPTPAQAPLLKPPRPTRMPSTPPPQPRTPTPPP